MTVAEPSHRCSGRTKGLLRAAAALAAAAWPFTAAAQGSWAPTATAGAPAPRTGHAGVWTGSSLIVWGGTSTGGYPTLDTGGVYEPATGTWAATTQDGAPTDRMLATAVWTGSRMIVWGGVSDGFYGTVQDTGAMYTPATDSWTPMTVLGAPAARRLHTAVWTGSKMIVWGGRTGSYGTVPVDTGAVYDPATDTWMPTSTVGAPPARESHSAVWTGTRMIVWGGYPGLVNDGGVYDPATDTWSAISTAGAPSARFAHTAVWTGSRMIVWGGEAYAGGSKMASGGIYDPATNTWTPTSLVNAPVGRVYHAAVWIGSRMVIWGGQGRDFQVSQGGLYDPATDSWTLTNPTGAPTAREMPVFAWTGSKLIVWGGWDNSSSGYPSNTGGLYDPLALQPPRQFYTLAPCRVLDTRDPWGPTSGARLESTPWSYYFDVAGVCGVPTSATAVAVNLTVVDESDLGHLRLYPPGTPVPTASTINFLAGRARANNAVLALGDNGRVAVRCVVSGSSGKTHFMLDVNGYFQ